MVNLNLEVGTVAPTVVVEEAEVPREAPMNHLAFVPGMSIPRIWRERTVRLSRPDVWGEILALHQEFPTYSFARLASLAREGKE